MHHKGMEAVGILNIQYLVNVLNASYKTFASHFLLPFKTMPYMCMLKGACAELECMCVPMLQLPLGELSTHLSGSAPFAVTSVVLF